MRRRRGRTCAANEDNGDIAEPFMVDSLFLLYRDEPFEECAYNEEAAGEVGVERLVPLSERHGVEWCRG